MNALNGLRRGVLATVVCMAASALAFSLLTTTTALAAAPAAGTNCQSQDGKISGRGATLQEWLLYDLFGQYTNDICGQVASQGANDVTDPSNPSVATGITFGGDWVLAYDYPNAQAASGTGSGQGQSAMICHSDAFGGTDTPATKAQLTTMDGAPAACSAANIQNGTDPPPFTPQVSPATGAFPNLGDIGATGGRGNASNSVMTLPIGASAVAIAADLPTDCVTTGNTATTQPLALSTADMENIWAGLYTDWSQLIAADPNTGLAAGCSGAITRVVRQDNSDTTQGFDYYLAEVGPTFATCDQSPLVSTLGALAQNEPNSGTNQLWPGGLDTPPVIPLTGPMNFSKLGCSHLISGAVPGDRSLIDTLNATSGGIGYADVSDIDHDPNLNATNDNLTLATVQGADGSQQSPLTGTFASGIFGSNCNFNGATLPGGGSAGAVGLVNLALANPGGWILGSGNTKDDITFSHEFGAYPICLPLWDTVWGGEDGNSPPSPTASDSVTSGVLQVSSLVGLPNAGSFTDAGSTFNYTGLSNSAATCGGTSTACVTGVTGSGTVTTGDTLTWPQGTGGPLANLTADQRRTLYTFYLWLFSAEGQSSESNVGYAPLPTSWQTAILAGFEANF